MKLITASSRTLARSTGPVPVLIADAGETAVRRYLEFFAATIRNRNTRAAYSRACQQFFAWCEAQALTLTTIGPIHIAAYIETHPGSAPTIKQHLAAIKMLCDWLVTGHIMHHSPAASVRGPRHVVKRGKTPVLSAEEARRLLDSLPITLIGLRDRALIAVMLYSFARVSAVVNMKVKDYYQNGRRCWIRLREKGGKQHEVPAHHNAEAYLDEYLNAAELEKDGWLFPSYDRKARTLSKRPLTRIEAFLMVRRRATAAGIETPIGCHSFRATGITAYLSNGGTIDKAQQIAAHESPRTTKLYDRTQDLITLDEVERILI